MLVTSQLPIHTTKIVCGFFDVHLCPPHFEKGSATHAVDSKFIDEKF